MENQNQVESQKFNGKIVSINPTLVEKVNGKNYLLCTVMAQIGKKEVPVTATFTLKENDQKALPEVGDSVILYHRALPSTTEQGALKHFFEIGRGAVAASDNEISAALSSVSTTSNVKVVADVATEAITG